MLGKPTDFWGKMQLDNNDEPIAWHPLFDHCADVAAVTERLLKLPVWSTRLASLAGGTDLDEVTRARLSVLAALHDIGKFNLGFQAKGRRDLGTKAGHVKEAIAAFQYEPFCACLYPLSLWGEGATGLLISSICHHGQPHNIDSCDGSYQKSWWAQKQGLDPIEGISQLLSRCAAWFPEAFTNNGNHLPDSADFEHAFAGLVMLADWIGSDTRFFPYSVANNQDRMALARPMALAALRAMAIDIDLGFRSDLQGRSPFERIAEGNFSPRPAQEAIISVPDLQGASIITLESETGSGKTEAALAHFMRLFEMGLVDGLYFALPTRTAATQIHQRVFSSVSRAFKNPPPVTLAVPGYLRVDDANGKKLPHFKVLWPDEDRFKYRGWAVENSKRFLAGAVVIGTIDQVLMSALKVNHAPLRATTLARSLLVVDEVHASDTYMTSILERVLEWHSRLGGHALLLSATLGSETRARLMNPLKRCPLPSLTDSIANPYPLVTVNNNSRTFTYDLSDDVSPRHIHVKSAPWLGDAEQIAQAAVGLAPMLKEFGFRNSAIT